MGDLLDSKYLAIDTRQAHVVDLVEACGNLPADTTNTGPLGPHPSRRILSVCRYTYRHGRLLGD